MGVKSQLRAWLFSKAYPQQPSMEESEEWAKTATASALLPNPGAKSYCSRSISLCFRSSRSRPLPNPRRLPSLAMTRWHGMMIASRFLAIA